MYDNPIAMTMQMMQSGGDPMRLMMQMVQQNPQLQPAMQLMRGKNPQQLEQVFYNLCKSRGVDPALIAGQYGVTLPKR